MQDNVECIDFSPREQYIVTFSPRTEDKRLIMWEILTGEEKRSFFLDGPSMWPIFKWSHDDKYVAYMGEDILSVYETPVSIIFFLTKANNFFSFLYFLIF